MKLKNLNKLILLTLIAISFMVSSCAPKFTPVYPEALNIQSTSMPGDRLQLVTKTYEEIQFKVQEITSDAFIGEKEQVVYANLLNQKSSDEYLKAFMNIAYGSDDIYNERVGNLLI